MPVLGAIGTIAAIVVFIVAHEAGHYLAAKATGMKVTEFFLGFGPRIWSFRRGETEYGVRPIPFGAYVKVVGMSPLEEVAPEDVGRTYREKRFWQKALVVLAGVGANFLLGYLILFGLALYDGHPVPTPEVAVVVPELEDGTITAAAAAGLRPGDRIVAIDGVAVPDWEAVSGTLARNPNQELSLTIVRDGTEIVVPAVLGEREDPETGEVVGFLGVAPAYDRIPIGALEAAGVAGRQTVNGVGYTFVTFARILRIDSLAELVGGVAGGDVSDDIRPISPVGLAQIGAQVDELGVRNLVFLLAVVNIVLGTLNALPLFPLDGGHFAVAVYERVTGRQADLRRLMPVAVAVIGILSLLGVMAIILDIVNPVDI